MMNLSVDQKGWGNASGSISLEASLVFPWVLMMTFLLLLFSLFISQGALLYYSSSIMAERAAFTWSNSAKNSITGAYPEGQYDGLYWRLTDDNLVQGLFGLVSGNEGTEVDVYPGMSGGEGYAAVDKLRRAGYDSASSSLVGTGDMSYRNVGIKREIGVRLTSDWVAQPLIWLRGGGAAQTDVTALVVEPTEFLRTFDLIRYYAAKMKNSSEGASAYRDKAGEVLNKRKK
ncbi:hypothetical protein [Cohnella mopanensis]|uniref:hypothetical protein n=1 Tax=Cohnella mopanensis TaxID=2911966 RepID=UPI001EF89421|nr:hypothetical protein [Cohnella mopanensis]